MIKTLGHLALNVTDMERSIHYYCDILGLKRAFTMENPKDGSPWIEYLGFPEGGFIELFYNGTPKPEGLTASTTGFNHICLTVGDIYAVAQEVRARGGEITVEPKQGNDGNWQCWSADPDGNRVEFMQMNPVSKQGKFVY